MFPAMLASPRNGLLFAAVLGYVVVAARADEPAAPAGPKYDLKYKFTAGETVRSKIVHTSTVHTTIKNTSETATSRAESEKVWRVSTVASDGTAYFDYSVEYVAMRGRVGDAAEVVYDSRKDVVAPEAYKTLAKTLRTPIAEVELDPHGRVLSRTNKLEGVPANVSGGSVTVVFPAEAIAVGHTWNEDFKIPVKLDGAGGRKVDRDIKARQKFKLEEVSGGVARISVVTQVLDPALPASIEVQLVQKIMNGEVKFDIARGRIIAQSMTVDGSVIDFHGTGSLMKCKMKIEEELLPAREETARKAGEKAVK
jgi:hypothetical protein